MPLPRQPTTKSFSCSSLCLYVVLPLHSPLPQLGIRRRLRDYKSPCFLFDMLRGFAILFPGRNAWASPSAVKMDEVIDTAFPVEDLKD